MTDPQVIDVLNELLAREQRSWPARLFESTVFVSQLSVQDLRLVESMNRMATEHARWLAELILALGGTPGPRIDDVTTADLHFQELHHLLPRLVHEHELLVRRYTVAAERVTSEPQAAQLVTRILERHQQSLEQLQERLQDNPAPAE